MVEKEGEVKVKLSEEEVGIRIKPAKGELKPPLEKEEGEAPLEEKIEAKKVVGRLPIHPAIIKPPFRLEGEVLAEITGYPGWIYTEEELEGIASLIAECGWEADPRLQILLGIVTMHGAKFAAYTIWRRRGRKGDLRKPEEEKAVK